MNELQTRYLDMLKKYDSAAMRCKQNRIIIWAFGLFCTWLPLMLAVAGLAKWLPGDWDPAVLHYVIPGVHTLAGILIVVQIIGTHRARWLQFRSAAERLRSEAMRFRTNSEPYHGTEDEKRFSQFLDDLQAETENPQKWSIGSLWNTRWRAALRMIPLPSASSPPDEGLEPRVNELDRELAIAIVRDRVNNQIAWHLRKAGYYYRRYLGWQVVLLSSYAVSMIRVMMVGHAYEVVLLGSVGLIVNAIRDFMEYGPLSWRYAQLAESLLATQARFESLLKDTTNPQLLLAEWANEVEERLAMEFRTWYQVQETVAVD